MKIRLTYITIWVFIIMPGNLFQIEAANAMVATASNYTTWMKHSDRVARVKIIKRRAIKYSGKGKINVYGWLMTAKVIQSWKGGKDDFTFFTPYEDNFIDFDRDYFVLARKGTPIKVLSEINFPKKCQTCKYETITRDDLTGNYRAILNVQSVFPFDTEAHKKFGSEWLILLPRRVDAQISIMSKFRDIYKKGDKRPESFKYMIQKWPDFLNDMLNGNP